MPGDDGRRTNEKRTREHAYPRWLRHTIKAHHDTLPSTWGEEWNDPRSIILEPVCTPCQTTLNMLFENPGRNLVKDILAGKSVSPLDQATLVQVASWIAKTSLVIALSPEPNKPHIDPHVVEQLRVYLHRMLATGVPPTNSRVRIAGVHYRDNFAPEKSRFTADWMVTDPRPFTYVGVVPNLVWEFTVADGRTIAWEDAGRYLTGIWPATPDEIAWPPDALSPWEIRGLRFAHRHDWIGGGFPRVFGAALQ